MEVNMGAKPLVSISCNTYNHAGYIAEAIEGFLAQRTNFPIEILIHDDASTDGTADIVRQYQARYPELIKPIYQIENQHSKRVRIGCFNLERAQGEYVALCEGDDYWTDPLKLQKQVEFLQSNPGYVMCFTNHDKIDKDGNLLAKGVLRYGPNVELTQHEILTGLPPRYLTVVFRRSAIDFSFLREKFSSNGDVVLFAMLTRKGNAKYLDFVSGCYRIHPGGVWSSKSEVERGVMKLRNSSAMLKIFKRPEEAGAIKTKMGNALHDILRLARERRSPRIFMVFLRELMLNLFNSRVFFLFFRREYSRKLHLKEKRSATKE
jgi:glycosyltransferase involved in cell wall biosynthesis